MKTNNRRKLSVRSKVKNVNRPRLSVFRSNKHIYAQVVDPISGKTVVGASDQKIDAKVKGKVARAELVGTEIAKLALAKKIKEVVFDRGGYKYHGRVKALADKAREAGLVF